MSIHTLYQIDAFAESQFTGNPAAVLILDKWLPTEVMQNIAMENNLSETAFVVPQDNFFHIRFYSPTKEIALCGHATLAAGYVLFNILKLKKNQVCFRTKTRGDLYVSYKNGIFTLDFPVDELHKVDQSNIIIEGINETPLEVYKGKTDLMLVFNNEEIISQISPDFNKLKTLKYRGIITTSPGRDVDFVSRFFAPALEINEDPVTGSAHTTLTPFWSKKLGKTKMVAKQLSKRGGTLYCENKGERINIGGKAVHYLTGTISI